MPDPKGEWSLKENNSELHYGIRTVHLHLGLSGRVAQSVGHLTRKSGVLGSIPGLATKLSFLLPLFQEVLVNRLAGLSLPRKSVIRLTDRPDMTLDVNRGRKTTMQ